MDNVNKLNAKYAALTSSTRFKADEGQETPSGLACNMLKFSTGGIRARIDHGFTYINDVTVNIVVSSLVDYLKTTDTHSTAFVGFDGRRNSTLFAFIAASVFNMHGFKVTMHDKPVITPFVSYMAKEFDVGVMITASHNGKEYNGIKIFLKGGCQVSAPVDTLIESRMAEHLFTDIDMRGYEFDDDTVVDISRVEFIGRCEFGVCLDRYCRDFSKNWCTSFRHIKAKKVLFSPLYGPGKVFLQRMAEIYKCEDVIVYYEPHCVVDSGFGNVEYPNPEVQDVFREPIAYAESKGINVVMVTDPDGDRFSIAQKNSGQPPWHFYDADEIAVLLSLIITGMFFPDKITFFNTFYCSGLLKEIANTRGVRYFQTETGFKNISHLAQLERNEGRHGILAYEDSYGFLIGDSAEKDAIPCCVMIVKLLQCDSCVLDTSRKMNFELGLFHSVKVHHRVENPETLLRVWIEALGRRYECILRGKTYEVFGMGFQLFIRTSGTESMIKLYANSRGKSRESLERELNDVMKQLIGVPKE